MGSTSPDRYRLDADLNLTDQQIGQKRLKVVADLSNPDGSRLEGVPVHQQTKPVLSPAQATRIAELAARAERLNDGPQDMEWAMVGTPESRM